MTKGTLRPPTAPSAGIVGDAPDASITPGSRAELHDLTDNALLAKVRKPGARLEKLLADIPANYRLVEELYLWALARWPSARERGEALQYLGAGERKERAEDLFWALLNHREFLVNH